jgi:hypothetical protein
MFLSSPDTNSHRLQALRAAMLSLELYTNGIEKNYPSTSVGLSNSLRNGWPKPFVVMVVVMVMVENK